MRTPTLLTWLPVAAVLASSLLGCGSSSGGGGGGGGGADADLAFCVDENNRYRAMKDGLTPFARSTDLEAFAATGADVDSGAMMPHKHFKDTNGGGLSFAENEIPGWSGWNLSQWGTVHAVMAAGIKLMWEEGPGTGAAHGHYENIVGPYARIGCGVVVRDDAVTVTMDFGH